MLFNLLLASITILLCFSVLSLVVFNCFFTIPVVIENARLPLIVHTGAPITLGNDAIEMLPVVTEIKQLMAYQNSQKKR